VSIIKPRTRGKVLIAERIRLDAANRETLFAYAAFLDEDVDYVVNQLIESVLDRDREFAPWRAQHRQSYAPPRAGRPQPGARRAAVSRSTPVEAASTLSARPSRE
jgi:hypothetical protein